MSSGRSSDQPPRKIDQPPRDRADDCNSITLLIKRLRSSEKQEFQEAASKIWAHYLDALLAMARQRLSPDIRRREDEEDILQSVFASFCRRQRESGFVLADRDDLWRLLVSITENKAINVRAHHTRQRRDVRREQRSGSNGEISPALDAVESPLPTPEEAAILVEEMRTRLDSLDEPLQRLAIWKLQGYTNVEIAEPDMMDCAVRTVERKLSIIRQIWARDLPEDQLPDAPFTGK